MSEALGANLGSANVAWSLGTTLPWWLLPPVVVAVAVALWWLHRRDLMQVDTRARRTLSGLRLLTATVLLLMAWQPALVQSRTQHERPWLLLADDRSASMQALDLRPDASARLDAAQGLGLLPINARPDAARRARGVVDTIVAQRDPMTAAMAATLGTASPRWRTWCQTQAAALDALTPELAGTADLGPRLTALVRTLTTLAHGFAANPEHADADAAAWRSALADVPALLAALSAAQAATDAALLAGSDATAPVTQAVIQVAALTRAQRSAAALRRLRTRLGAQADLATVGFAREVVTDAGSPAANNITAAANAINATASSPVPSADGTDFSAVLTYAARDWPADRPLAAVVLLSDGRQNGGSDGIPAARALAHRGAWLATVAIGDAQPPCDAVVAALDAPAEAQLGEVVRLDARVRVTALPGNAWQATLSVDGATVARRTLVGNEAWQGLHFEHTPSTPGLHRYSVDLAASDSNSSTTEASLANNQADAVVVVSAGPLRALIVDATPRWEARYLATVIARQSGGARVDSRFVLGQAGGAGLGAELDDYDLLVLGDLTPEELDAEAQTRCERFVARRGGCVVVISGPRGMPARFGLGGLAELLPVRGAAVAPARPAMVGVTLTDAGATHPITTLLDDPALNRRLWPLLPPVSCVAPGLTAKPDALVLLCADDRARSPLLVVAEHGAGRVLWLGTDETWRWRAGLGDRLQQAFWQQALRYGLGSRLRGRDARLQLAVERAVLSPGDRLEVRARVRAPGAHARLTLCALDDRDTAGPERELTLSADGGSKDSVKSAQNADADLWQATVPNLAEGRWRLTLSAVGGGAELQTLSETRDVVVRGRAGTELAELAADPGQLTRLAQAGDGQAYDLGELDQLADELARRLQPVPVTRARTWRLWAGWPAVVLATLLLSSEWLLRRRVGRP